MRAAMLMLLVFELSLLLLLSFSPLGVGLLDDDSLLEGLLLDDDEDSLLEGLLLDDDLLLLDLLLDDLLDDLLLGAKSELISSAIQSRGMNSLAAATSPRAAMGAALTATAPARARKAIGLVEYMEGARLEGC